MQVGDSVDLSILAHVSEGYTAGSIYRSVKATLTPRRVHRLNKHPLLNSDFLGALAQQPQLLKKDVQAREAILRWNERRSRIVRCTWPLVRSDDNDFPSACPDTYGPLAVISARSGMSAGLCR